MIQALALPPHHGDTMARFSVVVPAYNAQATLAETLDAIVGQTHREWECVVVDDGSTDDTFNIAELYVREDTRFRVLHQENRGSAGAYNTGVAAAGLEWICICSADDVLLPQHLSTMASVIEANPQSDIISCDGYYWMPDGTRKPVYASEEPEMRSWSLEDVLHSCFFSVGACYRRRLFELVGGYPEGAYGEDFAFWLQALAHGAKHLYMPEPLSLHRISATQKSADLRRAFESDIESIRLVVGSHLLTPQQARAARAAVIHRKRLIFELGPLGGAAARILRSIRRIAGGRA